MVNNWFYENFMVLNPRRGHYIFLGKMLMLMKCLTLNGVTIESSKEVELLGIKIHHKLNFNNSIKSICWSRVKRSSENIF